MIFLIIKIFVYLLLAAVIGAAAGWLIRNLKAQKTEENAARAVNDAKAKLPQLESLLRGRDEQIAKLKDQLTEAKTQLNEQVKETRATEQKLKEQEREARRLQQSVETRQLAEGEQGADIEAMDQSGDTDTLITELSSEIARLKAQLAEREKQPAVDATETLLQVEIDGMRANLKNAERELARAQAELAHEQAKISELERERELQVKSLRVLHQQLELARNRRTAAG